MKSKDFTTTLLVDQTPAEVFNAINNVRAWWSQQLTGNSEKLGDEFEFEVKGVHYTRHKLVEVVPEQKVVWLITESNLTFIKDHGEWTNTKIIFDISRQGDKTKLVFTHQGLLPESECYQFCSPAWTEYVQHSLHQLITTGKGDPNLEGKRIKPVRAAEVTV